MGREPTSDTSAGLFKTHPFNACHVPQSEDMTKKKTLCSPEELASLGDRHTGRHGQDQPAALISESEGPGGKGAVPKTSWLGV